MNVNITECPRDAMQGQKHFIPTELKVRYLNQLLKVGFEVLDFGSFVSPKAIPQMRDTAEVLSQLDLADTDTKLLAIVANLRGANDALEHQEITYLGYPLSLSETFQQRNTNRSIEQAMEELTAIQAGCQRAGKTLLVYLSMGFGNPYGDAYNPEMLRSFTQNLVDLGIYDVALADTVGVAQPETIRQAFQTLIPAFPKVRFGAHLHATPDVMSSKVKAAWEGGCRRFDSALLGFGGCPMAKDDLTGNIATEQLITTLEQLGAQKLSNLDQNDLQAAQTIAQEIFAPAFED